MQLYVYNDRHVVEVTGEEVDGKVPVRWVGLAPAVAGVQRRGARPKFAKPVPLASLTEAPQEVRAAVSDTETTTTETE